MLQADRRDAGVVNAWARDAASRQQASHFGPVSVGFNEQGQRGRFQPRIHLIQRDQQRSWRAVNSRMSHNGQKFVNACPRNSPGRPAAGQRSDTSRSRRVEGRFAPVRINENVGIDSDQGQRLSLARSRISCQFRFATSGCRPSPLKLASRSRNGLSFFFSATTCRRPCSTRARSVVLSSVAFLRVSRSNGSDISSVVFIAAQPYGYDNMGRSEEHTSELQSPYVI